MYVLWISMIWKPLQSPAEPPMRTACLRRRAGSYRFIVVHCWPLKWKRMKSDIAYYSSIQKQCLQSTFESLNHLEPLFKKKMKHVWNCLNMLEIESYRINQDTTNYLCWAVYDINVVNLQIPSLRCIPVLTMLSIAELWSHLCSQFLLRDAAMEH